MEPEWQRDHDEWVGGHRGDSGERLTQGTGWVGSLCREGGPWGETEDAVGETAVAPWGETKSDQVAKTGCFARRRGRLSAWGRPSTTFETGWAITLEMVVCPFGRTAGTATAMTVLVDTTPSSKALRASRSRGFGSWRWLG